MLLCCRQDRTLAVTYSVWQGKQLRSKLGLAFVLTMNDLFPLPSLSPLPEFELKTNKACDCSYIDEEFRGMSDKNSRFSFFLRQSGKM